MPSSRYARLNPFASPQLAADPTAEEPLQFSNFIPDPSYNPPPRAHTGDRTKKRRSKANEPAVSQVRSDGLAYTGFDGDVPRPAPQRRRTNGSLYRAASSIRDFAVSHFAVPKLAAPWEHELSEKHGASLPPSTSVREFDYRRQRRRLLTNSCFQWLVTAFICAALAGTLYGYSTLITGMSARMKYVFNALVTGLSLCLGLNLASSLRVYAQMMRWRFLASGYRTLQDFELVMNCDSQSKVFRLIWAGRTRGRRLPNMTQILAVTWLFVNVALQVFTALLGLTYSIDVSSEFVRLTFGNVSVADVSYIANAETNALYANNRSSGEAVLAETGVANQLGITGQDFSVWNTSFSNYFANEASVYTDGDLFWYRFIDRSPLALQLATATRRTVNATATCKSFEVTYGGYAGFQTDNDSLIWDVTWVDSNGDENTWWIPDQATGATTWLGNMTSDCGPRCAQVFALQVADNTTDVPKPRFWSCLSTVSTVDGTDLYIDPDRYQMPDLEAQIFAGAIGWSGSIFRDGVNDTSLDTPETQLQMVPYQVDSQWSPSGNITAEGMAQLVMKFTTGAISAMDALGPRLNVTGYGPAPAQVVNVKWRFAASILGGLPFAQALVLFAVILFANKAIIKDTSHLSTARLLRPIVDKLGDRGCLLTGDEIAEELGNYKVIYGVREPNVGLGGGGVGIMSGNSIDDGKIRHLDILDQSEGLGYKRGRMPEGRYDGMYPVREEEMERLLEPEKEVYEEEESDSADEDDDAALLSRDEWNDDESYRKADFLHLRRRRGYGRPRARRRSSI